MVHVAYLTASCRPYSLLESNSHGSTRATFANAMSSYGGRGPTVNAALWTETALALILVMMRIYTRVKILRSFGWDDGLLILTWVCLLPKTGIKLLD